MDCALFLILTSGFVNFLIYKINQKFLLLNVLGFSIHFGLLVVNFVLASQIIDPCLQCKYTYHNNDIHDCVTTGNQFIQQK